MSVDVTAKTKLLGVLEPPLSTAVRQRFTIRRLKRSAWTMNTLHLTSGRKRSGRQSRD